MEEQDVLHADQEKKEKGITSFFLT